MCHRHRVTSGALGKSAGVPLKRRGTLRNPSGDSRDAVYLEVAAFRDVQLLGSRQSEANEETKAPRSNATRGDASFPLAGRREFPRHPPFLHARGRRRLRGRRSHWQSMQ